MTLSDAEAEVFYREALACLKRSGVPFLLGGAYALAHYTGIIRRTKDLDIFIRPADCGRALQAFDAEGFLTEITDVEWLAKASREPHFVDIIFSSGNAIATVDDGWFEHAESARTLGWDVKVAPVEETIWSKAFVMERDRFDGADVLHLILKQGRSIDWDRLLERMGEDWPVLFAHLVLFQYCYPSERETVPSWVLEALQERLREERERGNLPERLCRGPRISRVQYRTDIYEWSFIAPARPKVGLVLAVHPKEEVLHADDSEQEDSDRGHWGSSLPRGQRGAPA